MAGLKELALVPVRRVVYVGGLPFVLVWMVLSYICVLLHTIVAKIVSIPANYVRRTARRFQVTWKWTKNSAKSMLPWKSNHNNARGTQTLDSVTEGYELEDAQFYDRDHRLGIRGLRRAHSGHSRRYRKKAIISSLIRLLADPASPQESEEETEILDDDDRVYKLIRDLVQFSKSGLHSQIPQASRAQVLDIETLREHARDKEKLQALILELDQYVESMDSENSMDQYVDSQRQEHSMGGISSHRSGTGLDITTSLDQGCELLTPDPAASSNADTDIYIDASEGELEEVESEYADARSGGTVDGDEFDDSQTTLESPVCWGLSPVTEVSPEVASIGSTESLDRNYGDIESELDTALSHLNTLTNELDQQEFILESRQTKITETVIIATGPDDRTEGNDSYFEDAPDDFPSIPRTSPTLGLDVGHSRRNLGTARHIRPPSLPTRNHQQLLKDQPSGVVEDQFSSEEFEEDDSELSEETTSDVSRGSGEKLAKKLPGAIQVLPHSLSEQLQLLTPSHGHSGKSHQTSDIYSAVNMKGKPVRARAKSEDKDRTKVLGPDPHRNRSVSDGNPSTSAEVEKNTTPEKSLFMHDLTPPWKQMRSRNSSSSTVSSTESPATTPSHASTRPSSAPHITQHSTPPPPPPPSRKSLTPSTQSMPKLVASSAVPLPQQQLESKQDLVLEAPGLYDKLPRVLPAPPIPSRGGEEGVYDSIPSQRRYLHEKMAVGERKRDPFLSTPPVSWTPQLPPRNSSNVQLKRTSSEEVMGTLSKNHELGRRGSDERSSAHEFRERSHSSSSSKKGSDRDGRVRRDRSSSEHHCHDRSGELSESDRHRRSSEKHRSSEKKSKSKRSSDGGIPSVWKILTGPSPSPALIRKEKEEKEKSKKSKDGKRKSDNDSSKLKKKDEGCAIPRNESSSSLKSGVIMLSTDSENLV